MLRQRIFELLENENISLYGVCPIEVCKINKPYLLERARISHGSVIVFAIPYFSEDSLSPDRNISAYAVCRDYHDYTKSLFKRLGDSLSAEFPENAFAFFSDHSPIDERDAAVKCGIGFFGRNGLLISRRYSSYMFIAEIITNAHLESDGAAGESVCIGCGRCISACPMNADGAGECLSAITQKKGELSANEVALMKKYNTFWGCDVCQEVCPYTERAVRERTIFTKIDYFNEGTTPTLTAEAVRLMSDEEFSKRAYSWRGRNVILRNLEYLHRESTSEKENETKK